MTTEILYCARCRRVIRPREISEGHYHFADGEPICSECFTRLSRRLRPVSGVYEPPKPVDLSGIVEESADVVVVVEPDPPSEAQAANPAEAPSEEVPVPEGAAGPSPRVRLLVLAAFVLAGLLAGTSVYLITRGIGRKPRGQAQAGPPAAAAVRPAGRIPEIRAKLRPVEAS